MSRFIALIAATSVSAVIVSGCGAPDAAKPVGETAARTDVPPRSAPVANPASAPARAPEAKPAAPQVAAAKPAFPMADQLFTGTHPRSKVTNGGFEWFYEGSEFPLDWTGLLASPTCVPEEAIIKQGKRSVKLTGLKDKSCALISKTAPSIEELRGKEVTFGAWIYTSDPEKTAVSIIFDWSKYHSAQTTKKNTWTLVKVTTTIPEDATFLHFAVNLQGSDTPVVCYVDGADLQLGAVK